jgi:hypothetical protein
MTLSSPQRRRLVAGGDSGYEAGICIKNPQSGIIGSFRAFPAVPGWDTCSCLGSFIDGQLIPGEVLTLTMSSLQPEAICFSVNVDSLGFTPVLLRLALLKL